FYLNFKFKKIWASDEKTIEGGRREKKKYGKTNLATVSKFPGRNFLIYLCWWSFAKAAMAEPTFVMHAFSYSSGISNEAQEDNPMYALEESVSLGRFMSESLSWEKWSSFSRNRYVEEAEMYSRPGSVKQKKAYFEAHFKRMAALKAAALLEQSNPTQGEAPDPPKLESPPNENGAKIDDPSSPLSTLDQQWVEKEDVSSSSVDSYNEEKSNDGEDQLESEVVKAIDQGDYDEDEFNEHFMDVEEQYPSNEIRCKLEKTQDETKEQYMDFEEQYPSNEVRSDLEKTQDENKEQYMDFEEQYPSNEVRSDLEKTQDEIKLQFMDFEEQYPSTEMECDIAKAQDSCVEVDVFHECVVENKDYDSDFVADQNEDDKDSGEEDDPSAKIIEQAEPIEQHFMDVEKQIRSTEMESGLVKKDDPLLECSSVHENTITATSTRSKPNPLPSAFVPLTPKGKMNPSSYMPSMEAETTSLASSSSSSPTKSLSQPAAVHPGKENTFTPIGRKSWIDDPEKKRTPLRMSINRELNRLLSPVIKKMGSSSKASKKDCSTPLKTPAKASLDGMKINPPETPQSGKRRARALFDSSGFGGTKATGSRWQFLSSEKEGTRPSIIPQSLHFSQLSKHFIGVSKSPAGGKNKTNSPIIPKSFCLNGSRAPRRKEARCL
ncbi:hypothetical protein V2J09_020829, partial [Rumex salicifolius]